MFDICLNQGRLVGHNKAVGGCVRTGGCLKYLKWGGTEKRGGETKGFKMGGTWVKGWMLYVKQTWMTHWILAIFL